MPRVETILAIETSVPEASIALWSGGEYLFEKDFTNDRHHNSMVFNVLEEVLQELGDRELSAVLVGTGPGSYSGTRVGIAVAQGVAIARDCPAVGLGSMAATPVAREKNSSMAVGDARRGLYFISQIAANGEAMKPELMDAEAFGKYLSEAAECALFTLDDPLTLGMGLGSELEERVLRTRPEARLLIDVWMGLDADRRRELTSQPLSPTYLRAPFTSKAKAGHPLIRKVT